MPKDKAGRWAMEQLVVALTSVVLGGIVIQAFTVDGSIRGTLAWWVLMVYLGLLVWGQAGFLISVKLKAYRTPIRLLLDIVMLYTYFRTVEAFEDGTSGSIWIASLVTLFVVWDLMKLLEYPPSGGRRRIPAQRKLWVSVAVSIASWAIVLGAHWTSGQQLAHPRAEMYQVGLLIAFWIAKAVLNHQASSPAVGRKPKATV